MFSTFFFALHHDLIIFKSLLLAVQLFGVNKEPSYKKKKQRRERAKDASKASERERGSKLNQFNTNKL